MVKVSRSLEVKRPWRLNGMPQNDLVCLAMFRRVLCVSFVLN